MPGLTHAGRPNTIKSGPLIIDVTPQPTTGQGRIPTQRKVQVPAGYIFLSCSSPQLALLVRLGPEAWIPTGGWGGYEVVDRPQNVGMTVPKGVEPWQYTGSIMFDGLKHLQSQEDDIQALLLCTHGDDDTAPGIISISGLPDLPADDWVVEALDFDADSIIRHNRSMDRLRAKVTLTIREYVHPDYLRTANNAFKRPKGDTTIITSKTGDTPHKIAIRQGCDWKDIKRLNPMRKITKANQILKKGLRIRVPKKENKSHKTHRSGSRSTNRSGKK
jgi:hypothetical protein